jgi:hypothetical protein
VQISKISAVAVANENRRFLPGRIRRRRKKPGVQIDAVVRAEINVLALIGIGDDPGDGIPGWAINLRVFKLSQAAAAKQQKQNYPNPNLRAFADLRHNPNLPRRNAAEQPQLFQGSVLIRLSLCLSEIAG